MIDNAIDAIKDLDERWIKIHLSDYDSKILLSIADSGSKIPEDIANKLFDPFFTTKGVGKGTGLGLSITYNILKEHNASIELDRASENTRFVLTFPTIEKQRKAS
ncbi:GHKL domain-containing protein [bacterium]|nr:GHKL domain-containing protein [bacterium]